MKKIFVLIYLLFFVFFSYSAQNILEELDFKVSIFYKDIPENPENINALIKVINSQYDMPIKISLFINFLKKSDLNTKNELFNTLLKNEKKSVNIFLILTEYSLLNLDRDNILMFKWHLYLFSKLNYDDAWYNFISSCILFSLDNAMLERKKPEKEDEIFSLINPYVLMENSLKLADNGYLHFLIALVFKHLAYTNTEAHKIVVIELKKVEEWLKLKNRSINAFLNVKIDILRDFIELYRFYNKDVPFYLQEVLYKDMIKLNSKDAIARNNLADLYLRYNVNLDEAKKELDIAIGLMKDNPYIYDTMGYYYYLKRDYDKAREFFLKAIKIKPDLNTAYEHLAELYYSLNDIKNTIFYYEKLVDLYPDNHRYLNDLGYLLADNNMELERALELCKKAVRFNPTEAIYLDSLAWCYFKLNKFSDAYSIIKAAVKIKDDEPYFYYHAGRIAEALKDTANAIKYYKKALTLRPTWDIVIKHLANML